MHVREWINNNSISMTAAAAALLVVALTVVFFQVSDSGGMLGAVYFLDLETGEMFEQPGGTLAPVAAPSGGRGVRAHLYTCGDCTPEEWFGYIETFTEQARQTYEEQGYLPDGDENHRVRDLRNGQWVPYFSQRGEQIIEQVYHPCPDDHDVSPRVCLP